VIVFAGLRSVRRLSLAAPAIDEGVSGRAGVVSFAPGGQFEFQTFIQAPGGLIVFPHFQKHLTDSPLPAPGQEYSQHAQCMTLPPMRGEGADAQDFGLAGGLSKHQVGQRPGFGPFQHPGADGGIGENVL